MKLLPRRNGKGSRLKGDATKKVAWRAGLEHGQRSTPLQSALCTQKEREKCSRNAKAMRVAWPLLIAYCTVICGMPMGCCCCWCCCCICICGAVARGWYAA